MFIRAIKPCWLIAKFVSSGLIVAFSGENCDGKKFCISANTSWNPRAGLKLGGGNENALMLFSMVEPFSLTPEVSVDKYGLLVSKYEGGVSDICFGEVVPWLVSFSGCSASRLSFSFVEHGLTCSSFSNGGECSLLLRCASSPLTLEDEVVLSRILLIVYGRELGMFRATIPSIFSAF